MANPIDPVFSVEYDLHGLKALAYPLNRLMAHITNDPHYNFDDSPKAQKTWQKVMAGTYNVLAAIVAFPFVLADFAVTAALGTVSMALFSIMHVISSIVEKLQSLRAPKDDNLNNEISSGKKPTP